MSTAAPTSRAGRNLPAAIAVAIIALSAVAASLAFRPEPFVVFVVVAIGGGLWELKAAFERADIELSIWPLLAGSVAMAVSSFRWGIEALLLAYILTVMACAVWRMVERPDRAAITDIAADVFAITWLPLLASFVILILSQDRGNWRVAMFILAAVASDTGGYAAGVLFGKHPMAPTVSPKKSWEGFVGSVVLASVVGVGGSRLVLGLPFLPHGHLFSSALVLGLLLGVLVAVTATVGDLAESLLKRDLGMKDMGSLLPGHGGVLDRVDSILVTAPFFYLVVMIAVQ